MTTASSKIPEYFLSLDLNNTAPFEERVFGHLYYLLQECACNTHFLTVNGVTTEEESYRLRFVFNIPSTAASAAGQALMDSIEARFTRDRLAFSTAAIVLTQCELYSVVSNTEGGGEEEKEDNNFITKLMRERLYMATNMHTEHNFYSKNTRKPHRRESAALMQQALQKELSSNPRGVVTMVFDAPNDNARFDGVLLHAKEIRPVFLRKNMVVSVRAFEEAEQQVLLALCMGSHTVKRLSASSPVRFLSDDVLKMIVDYVRGGLPSQEYLGAVLLLG